MSIRREFLHTTLNDLGKSRSVELRQIFSDCLDQIERIVPTCRELAIVRTKLEEAGFFAQKGMAGDPENQGP